MRVGRWVIGAAAALLSLALTSVAAANSVSLTASPNPARPGQALTATATGKLDASASNGASLAFKYQPVTMGPCENTPDSDFGKDVTGNADVIPPGSFRVQSGTISPAVGTYFVCGWLLDNNSGQTLAFAQVQVTVGSTGCNVPAVSGRSFAEARRRILHAHCTVGRITRRSGGSSSRRKVISQRPKGGSRRARDFPVDLVVGR